jgi:hypothetical protein
VAADVDHVSWPPALVWEEWLDLRPTEPELGLFEQSPAGFEPAVEVIALGLVAVEGISAGELMLALSTGEPLVKPAALPEDPPLLLPALGGLPPTHQLLPSSLAV